MISSTDSRQQGSHQQHDVQQFWKDIHCRGLIRYYHYFAHYQYHNPSYHYFQSKEQLSRTDFVGHLVSEGLAWSGEGDRLGGEEVLCLLFGFVLFLGFVGLDG